MFHPNQLEKRFGGHRDTPTNFWPPYMGTEFIPPNERAERGDTFIDPKRYEEIVSGNSELLVHPNYFTKDRFNNAHFKPESGVDETKSSAYNLHTMQSDAYGFGGQ